MGNIKYPALPVNEKILMPLLKKLKYYEIETASADVDKPRAYGSVFYVKAVKG